MGDFSLKEFDLYVVAVEKSDKMSLQEFLAIAGQLKQAAVKFGGDVMEALGENFDSNAEIEAIDARTVEEAIRLRGGDATRDVYREVQLTPEELQVVKNAVSAIAVVVFEESHKCERMASAQG